MTFCYNTCIETKKGLEMRETILAKLAEVETMLDESSCSGDQLAECGQVYRDIMDKLSALSQAVHYYVD
jgi:hypothetical protein